MLHFKRFIDHFCQDFIIRPTYLENININNY